jgi:tetratricopeptide (TPR) repeat protein
LKGDFFENLGKLKMQLSDLHGALSNFSEAFSIFSDLNDKFSVFRCRVYMSVIHHKSGSTDSAKHEMSLCTTYLLQEKFILKGESLEPISLWLMNLITFAADSSDQQKTIQNILTAFESHPIDSQFSLFENFLETIQKSKQKKLGVFISQLFLQFLQKNYQEKPGTIARALYFAANEQAKAGAFSSAIQLAEDCLKIQERIGHKYNMAMTLNLLMQIQMRNDDWNSAYSYLERFGKIAKETGDESLLKLYSDYKSL